MVHWWPGGVTSSGSVVLSQAGMVVGGCLLQGHGWRWLLVASPEGLFGRIVLRFVRYSGGSLMWWIFGTWYQMADCIFVRGTGCKVGAVVVGFIACTNPVPTRVSTSPSTISTNKSNETDGMSANKPIDEFE
jgi:hypothetical protein